MDISTDDEMEIMLTMTITLNSRVPDFSLPDTNGTLTRFYQTPLLITAVVFTCNRCPYALAWHGRIDAVGRDYDSHGVRLLQINSNDATRHPLEGNERMRQRVAAGEFAGPYLRDESQEVARAWGATVTPEVFVVDAAGMLRYHGAPDADHADDSQRATWLRSALDDLLSGRAVAVAETRPNGCPIKGLS
jgi:AhpC/TSA family